MASVGWTESEARTSMRPPLPPADEAGLAEAHAAATDFAAVRSRSTVDYTLRTLQQTLTSFSAMADNKANMMITVCSIVLTIGITQLESPLLRWPLLVLTMSTLAALLLAILAVLPSLRYPQREDGAADVASPAFNVLFFGHFAHLPRSEFERRVEALLESDAELYRQLVRDIYGQGYVLGTKKYRLLRWSYLIFLAGVFSTCAIAALRFVAAA